MKLHFFHQERIIYFKVKSEPPIDHIIVRRHGQGYWQEQSDLAWRGVSPVLRNEFEAEYQRLKQEGGVE